VTIILISLVNIWLLRDNEKVLVAQHRTRAVKWDLFKKRGKLALPALMLPVIVLGGIYGGIMTTTEASAVAVLYAIPVGIYVYKGFNWRGLVAPVVESAISTGVIMAMLFSVAMLSRLYLLEDLPSRMMTLFRTISDNRWVILFMINIFLVVMGMLMDDISVVVLTTPILMPIIMELGFNPIHYAAIVGVNTGLGCITPPAAPVLYLAGRLNNTSIDEMIRPALYFMFLCWGPVLLITSYFPKFVLFLPHVILGTPW
jgi:tripartite ATP-independent transporter DctM subunit